MLVAMAGLPGTGKSTLARRLAAELGGVVLCKDTVRTALFPPAVIDYSAKQNDLSMAAVYAAAELIVRAQPSLAVILDGRTFSRAYQVEELRAFAARAGQPVAVIECVCADDVARTRLERDAHAGTHPAGNRTYELYRARKASVDPLTLPRLTLDTGELRLEECVTRCLHYLRAG